MFAVIWGVTYITFILSVVLLIRTLIFRWTTGLPFLVIYENARNPYLITHLYYLLTEVKLQRWESCPFSLFSNPSLTYCVLLLCYECIGLLLPEYIGMMFFLSETNMIKQICCKSAFWDEIVRGIKVLELHEKRKKKKKRTQVHSQCPYDGQLQFTWTTDASPKCCSLAGVHMQWSMFYQLWSINICIYL